MTKATLGIRACCREGGERNARDLIGVLGLGRSLEIISIKRRGGKRARISVQREVGEKKDRVGRGLSWRTRKEKDTGGSAMSALCT